MPNSAEDYWTRHLVSILLRIVINWFFKYAISHPQLLKVLRLEQFLQIFVLWVFTEDLE